MSSIEQIKELSPTEDKINQILKAIEVMDISPWNGKNVFEASDADTLYNILETAFEQIRSETLKECQKALIEDLVECTGPHCPHETAEKHYIVTESVLKDMETKDK